MQCVHLCFFPLLFCVFTQIKEYIVFRGESHTANICAKAPCLSHPHPIHKMHTAELHITYMLRKKKNTDT